MDNWTIASWAVWLARWLPGGYGILKSAKTRLLLEPFRHTHAAIHTVRQIRALTEQINSDASSQAVGHLETLCENFCSQAAALLASLTATDASEVHCCVKLIEPGKSKAGDIVRTFVRSSNSGFRRVNDRDTNEVHYASSCSVWSSIHAINDGKNNWAGLPCFCCPDLVSAGSKFVCSRKDWQDRYLSTIALPIRYCLDGAGRERRLIGFLAFDTKNKSCLAGLPNAFSFVENPQAFEEQLMRSPVFDALASLTDSFGMALAGLWETKDNLVVTDAFRLPVLQKTSPGIIENNG